MSPALRAASRDGNNAPTPFAVEWTRMLDGVARVRRMLERANMLALTLTWARVAQREEVRFSLSV